MTPSHNQPLIGFIQTEWNRPVPHAVMVAVQDISNRYSGAVKGILFYGSCLRTGEIEDKVLDFYVIVESYRAAYASGWLAVANKILPPNVFYHEMDVDGVIVRSKYAVLSAEDFVFRVSRGCLNVSVWARFCQPCVLLVPSDKHVTKWLAGNIATAIETMIQNLRDLRPDLSTSRDVWVEAFEQTYGAELRSERRGKGLEIYLLDQARYDAISPLVFEKIEDQPLEKKPQQATVWGPRLKWAARRWNGKTVSFLRLVKASMTFDGGIDYLAWKIRRHSGVTIEVTDWMRRHPVLAGVSLFWKLRRKGAFK